MKMSNLRKRKENILGWAFITPYVSLMLAFLLYPFLKGVWISLHDWNLLEVAFNSNAKSFVGLDNYYKLLLPRRWDFDISQLWYLRLPLIALAVYFAWKWRQSFSLAKVTILAFVFFVAVFVLGIDAGSRLRMGDRRFWHSVFNTLEFVALTVPSITVLALALAMKLNQKTRFAALMRTIFFGTQVLSVTVVTLIWQMMYSPQQGFIANILKSLNLTAPSWLTDENLAMPALVVTTVWWSLGFALVVFLSGLQAIPADRLEAARLDNARGWRLTWYIVLPSIRRTTSFVVVMLIVLHFQVFGQSHLMTNGGPGDSTQVLVRYIYQTAFRDSEVGYASAMAMILFILMLFFSVLHMRLSRSEGES
ncbi:carbohydrate ABC transporter permease [Vibrio nigripulchritudo]|uniref:carbohydrate ABC transporter permease n=1 Tax=Vibrio nigripulchritudo TaxID=28173 RepID=UPI000697F469|nr:sugar ABC transporter permease [Vibrio nigripulchritudo]